MDDIRRCLCWCLKNWESNNRDEIKMFDLIYNEDKRACEISFWNEKEDRREIYKEILTACETEDIENHLISLGFHVNNYT